MTPADEEYPYGHVAVGPPGSSRKGVQTRERLLRASAELFAEQGFANSTMRQLADRAGTQLSAIYYYFPGKRDVLRAIMDRVLGRLEEAAEAAIEDAMAPASKLDALVVAHTLVHLDDVHSARVADGELHSLEASDAERVVSRRDAYEGRFRSVLAEGVASGDFAAGLDIPIAAMAILAMSTGVVTWWRSDGRLPAARIAELMGCHAVAVAECGDGSRNTVSPP